VQCLVGFPCTLDTYCHHSFQSHLGLMILVCPHSVVATVGTVCPFCPCDFVYQVGWNNLWTPNSLLMSLESQMHVWVSKVTGTFGHSPHPGYPFPSRSVLINFCHVHTCKIHNLFSLYDQCQCTTTLHGAWSSQTCPYPPTAA
jgi:hypothetical protein